MDTFRVLINAAKPVSRWSRLKWGAIFGVSGFFFISYTYDKITDYLETPHRLTVCWEHYRLMERSAQLPGIYSVKDYRASYNLYRDCIYAARKGNPIPPIN